MIYLVFRSIKIVYNRPKTTPLHGIGRHGMMTVNDVTDAITSGLDPNEVGSYGLTPLHCAIMNDATLDLVRPMLSHITNVNARDRNGNTPMHIVSWKRSQRIKVDETLVNELIRMGADLTIINKRGQTPLSKVFVI